ncbi:polysaccharide pyruvyl transferase family protein [Rosenbergiella collisarenosi]|uniref:polysaccharide pyruvyl transferase family protein n=1 Tax=Rosenbergiella collisarenosi TaxID=1544695 RepID=UPI001BDA75C0|nr:polysaccharide pyruvyl transferase family protein [Rosenbergiella collisarenosi]MBT0719874.1 hypothetical protein [Rosenbergiella collisarenosi]
MIEPLSDFESIIKFYHSQHTFVYKANPGNAGDGVIASATYDFFEKFNLDFEMYSASAKYNPNEHVLVFGGGGNLIEGLYREGRDFLEDNLSSFAKVLIFPSTIKGYSDFFREHEDKFVVFCREQTTYEYILSLGYDGNSCYLTDDMAFYLDLKKYTSGASVTKESCNCFRTDGESSFETGHENNHDISLTWNGDYWDNKDLARNSTRCMINFLESYSTINTDRLHVSILGCLLDKKVNFYPNSYYKNQAVFNYSILNKFQKVVFITS